ncbi:MAG: PCRF domain-containing protein, partial [Pirellulales bacterium]|nr:PCRF domain-containing protein [Pirellulales bacterium]
MAEADFWNDQESAQETVMRLKSLNSLLKPLDSLIASGGDLATMVEMADEDETFAAEVPGELDRLETLLDELEVKALLNGPLDANAAILTINARDGGTDANDWAEMLL